MRICRIYNLRSLAHSIIIRSLSLSVDRFSFFQQTTRFLKVVRNLFNTDVIKISRNSIKKFTRVWENSS